MATSETAPSETMNYHHEVPSISNKPHTKRKSVSILLPKDDGSSSTSSLPKIAVEMATPPADEKRFSLKFDRQNAVECHNLVFAYQEQVILNNVNLTVQQGKIFALLGASGCGKTTLLRNILGRLRPESGLVRVFGLAPGSSDANIPGPGVGFMPQELALNDELTISETLNYFGRVNHMPKSSITERTDFLVKFLNLPSKNRMIKQLSGGQQRRVSIAVTLIHQPPLLILDEPTVGVDPLLRQRIWEYLNELASTENVTVIITTHYIEEARTAGTVAMMRFGRILIQEQPDKLLAKYHCANLEEAFLKMCQEDTGDIKRRMSVAPVDKHAFAIEMLTRRRLSQISIKEKGPSPRKHFDGRRILALLEKNSLSLVKKPFNLFIMFLFPLLTIALSGITNGNDPRGLPISVFNGEKGDDLSKLFLDHLDKSMLMVKNVESLSEAVDEVRKGKSWFALSFHPNFSSSLDTRLRTPQDIDDETIDESSIKMHADMSNSIIGLFIYKSLVDSYQRFAVDYLSSENLIDSPLSAKEPFAIERLYQPAVSSTGASWSYFRAFTLSGVTIGTVFGMQIILTSFILLIDCKSGLMERSFVAGVRPSEMILSHLIILVTLLVFQVVLAMVVLFVPFGIPLRGHLVDAFGILFLSGFEGIGLGLLISSLVSSETLAFCVSFVFWAGIMFMSGVYWPLEAQPQWLQQLVLGTPLTVPINAFRSVLMRGWTVERLEIVLGYAISVVYAFVFIGLTIVIFKRAVFKKKFA